MPKPVIIDTDMAVDDWMAIAYLLQRNDVEVRAITVTADTAATCEAAVRNAMAITALAGKPNIPVAAGLPVPLHGNGLQPGWRDRIDTLLGIELPKAETRSDWLQRPLTAAQLDYAAQDVAHLPLIRSMLAEKLAALGRSEWLAEDCQRMVDRVCNAPPDAQPQRAFRGAAGWSQEQQALLRRVLRWRDTTARTLDKPRPWILDDAHALGLVAQPPADADELFERCKGQRALRGAQRQQLLEILHQPLAADELEIALIPAAPTSAQKRRLAALRDEVAAIAAQLGLPDGLLCPRRHLETLVYEGVWPKSLDGWRKPLLHDALMAAVA